ncbi:nuclear transcription factor Y subunit beta-like isoform X2 [Neopelma chrysocephalum]|uniref:nuclear transcription factor Y subunit beta-like isoform X2 n=1 Tax=Neopelma chrysocephalum TaxID=114329 RepID=UPI000FCD08BC|nr:nuclear transcription factor Y subunit beta-like isoform X2 [Neopelma chrysocephalum]
MAQEDCGAEETTPDLSNSIQQLQQETEAWQSQGQRQSLVLEPQPGEPRVCQDTQQQELEPADVLATIQALQRDLDFCRDVNRKRLAQLQQQECEMEQEHQDLVSLMQQCQVLMDKVSDASLHLKDEAAQTEVTSNVAAHSHSVTSPNIPVESRKLLEQLGTQENEGPQHSPAQLQQLGATKAQKQQSLQQLSGAEETIQGPHQEVVELQQQLCGQVQDTANLQEKLAQARRESTKQEKNIAVLKTQRQQLHQGLRKSSQQQSKQEERLQDLSRQAQYWQQLHVDSERALALREEELVVCKVELAFLMEELSKVSEQVQDTSSHSRHTRQNAGEPTPHSQNT